MTDTKGPANHKCKQNPGVHVEKAGDDNWRLRVAMLAGRPFMDLKIEFCPFCGIKLAELG